MAQKWEKLSHLEHVLKRPDSYIGSTQREVQDLYAVHDNKLIVEKLNVAPGLLKIFDEILVNALDQNALNPAEVTQIKVSVKDNEICVVNNGDGIPCVNHAEGMPVPELIFGHLLTSSNYDDTEERTTGGRNGYGSKLTNIYAKYFTVEVKDAKNQLHFKKTWTDNMTKSKKTSLKPLKTEGKGMVKITWEPDWQRFGQEGMTPDFLKVIEKRTWDAAMCTSKCAVSFNGQRVSVRSPHAYLDMHGTQTLAKASVGGWDVCVGMSDGFKQISWVNGICTPKGGTHVDAVATQLAKAIIAQKAKLSLKPQDIKNHLFLLIRATLGNPSFSSQAKVECTKKVNLPKALQDHMVPMAKQLLKGGLGDELEAVARFKESRSLKKTDGAKKSKVNVAKLDDANWAGTAKSAQCTLIITEGDSAKALAIAGLSVVGRDKYGVFPLRGKPRNVRDVGVKALTSNQEFSDLKKILGLQQGKVYESLSELRYGRLMVMTDADVDGTHIKGLILNMIHAFWPSLLKMNFVVSMITPVIRITGLSGGPKSFYTDVAYKQWLEQHGPLPQRAVVKYYKGLGTSTSKDAKDYFKTIDQLTVGFQRDPLTDKAILLAFDKTKADDRKEWLLEAAKVQSDTPNYGDITRITIDDFIKKDLVNFSLADNVRSIPHLMDGLKPSQRKVLYACFKRNLTSEMKVAQLSGYVSEHTAYHHGEASLQGTIVGLAQDYMGSNNINLLEPCGQFGSRLMNGKDSASPRYIFTRLQPITRKIFDNKDDPVLKYLEDDGKNIEPEYYCPIIPMVLVNGCEGIGTGFSTYIPPYNPKDIVDRMTKCIEGQYMEDIYPWFKGFKGSVEPNGQGSFLLTGRWEERGSKLVITELPPGKSTQEFKEHLDTMEVNYTNHSTEEQVHVVITGYKGKDVAKDFKLTKQIKTTNMHLWTPSGIKKYSDPRDIIRDFVQRRMEVFSDRKANMVKVLTKKTMELDLKAKFIEMVVQGDLVVFKRPKKELSQDILERLGKKAPVNMLLDIKTHQYTFEAIQELRKQAGDARQFLERTKATGEKAMWMSDISQLDL